MGRLPTPHATRWFARWPHPETITVDLPAEGINVDTGEPEAVERTDRELGAGGWRVYSLRNDESIVERDEVKPSNAPDGSLRLEINVLRLARTGTLKAPDRLRVEWTAGGQAWELFADIRLSTAPPVTAAAASAAAIAAGASVETRRILARDIATIEAEQCTRRTLIQDLGKITLGPGRYLLPADLDVQRIIRVEPLDGSAHITDAARIPDVDTDLGAVMSTPGKRLPYGGSQLVVECGIPAVPPDLADAIGRRWRHWATSQETAIPSHATSYAVDGTTYRLAMATRYRTGDATVDGVYARHRSAAL